MVIMGSTLSNGDLTMKKLILCSLFSLTACGGSGDGGSSGGITLGKVESLAGVWDNSEDLGVDGLDESYIAIDKDGYLSVYDFAGDTFDNWGNCYWIEEKFAQITYVNGDRYKIKDLSSSDSSEVEMTVSNQKLTIKEVDVDDLDEDGNTTEILTFELEKSSKMTADFKPKCVDSMAQARALIPAKREKLSPLVQ
jgi:hypothetical protein